MKLQGFSGKKSLEYHLCHVSSQGQPRFKGSRGTDSPLREGVAHAYKEGGTWRHGVPLQSSTIHFISEVWKFSKTTECHCLVNTNTPNKEFVQFY